MTATVDWDRVEALWVLGLLPSEKLPRLACDALASNVESVLLAQLAGVPSAEVREARGLFEQYLEESGRGRMSQIEALRHYARMVSEDILHGRLSPSDGARRISRASLCWPRDAFHELDPFIYADSELEDRPEDKDLFEKAIVEEAKQWTREDLHGWTLSRLYG